jgi:uncharacterized protein YqhQ
MRKPFNYGGQALIEGVMMRGQKYLSVAVRAPDNSIVTHFEPLDPRIYSSRINRIPFLRGFTLLWDNLVLGIKTLMFSANVAMAEEDVQFNGPIAWGTIAVSLLLGVGVFFIGPLLLISLIDRFLASALLSNILEGILRLLILLAYLLVISKMEDIRRVFAYHGAEHKTINAYEAGADLTPDAVDSFSTVHPRCGTSFLLLVVVISILVFSFLGRPPIVFRLLSRIVLIPVIAGIAYEFLKFSAAHSNSRLVKLFITPGLWLQTLTTRLPDKAMLEVSVTALKQLLELEQVDRLTEDQPASTMRARQQPSLSSLEAPN